MIVEHMVIQIDPIKGLYIIRDQNTSNTDARPISELGEGLWQIIPPMLPVYNKNQSQSSAIFAICQRVIQKNRPSLN